MFDKNNKKETEATREKTVEAFNGRLKEMDAETERIKKILNYSTGSEAYAYRLLLDTIMQEKRELIKDMDFIKNANLPSSEKAKQLNAKFNLRYAKRLDKLGLRLNKIARKTGRLGDKNINQSLKDVRNMKKHGIKIKGGDIVYPGEKTIELALDLRALGDRHRSAALSLYMKSEKGGIRALKMGRKSDKAQFKIIKKIAEDNEKRADKMEKGGQPVVEAHFREYVEEEKKKGNEMPKEFIEKELGRIRKNWREIPEGLREDAQKYREGMVGGKKNIALAREGIKTLRRQIRQERIGKIKNVFGSRKRR